MRQVDETSLMNKVGQGDRDALTNFYNTHIDRIYSSIFNQVGRDHNVTQEITQDTFLAAVKSAKNFKANSKVYTWLYSIANKKVTDYYRSKYRKRQILFDTTIDVETVENSIDHAIDPFETTDSIQLTRQAMDSLPLHYKQVIISKYVEEMSVEDIATAMNCTVKSIDGILSRAKKRLKSYLVNNGVREYGALERIYA
jgi:RNA polymerase sigma-70 factor (ECF subfamily)